MVDLHDNLLNLRDENKCRLLLALPVPRSCIPLLGHRSLPTA